MKILIERIEMLEIGTAFKNWLELLNAKIEFILITSSAFCEHKSSEVVVLMFLKTQLV